MFDVGASELLMIVIVAVVVIGPKDMPMALRTAGRWIGKMRKMSNHFRSGIDAMVREAELEEMERKWREQNEAIMKASPQLPSMTPDPVTNPSAQDMQPPASSQEPASSQATASSGPAGPEASAAEPRQSEMHLPPPPP